MVPAREMLCFQKLRDASLGPPDPQDRALFSISVTSSLSRGEAMGETALPAGPGEG